MNEPRHAGGAAQPRLSVSQITAEFIFKLISRNKVFQGQHGRDKLIGRRDRALVDLAELVTMLRMRFELETRLGGDDKAVLRDFARLLCETSAVLALLRPKLVENEQQLKLDANLGLPIQKPVQAQAREYVAQELALLIRSLDVLDGAIKATQVTELMSGPGLLTPALERWQPYAQALKECFERLLRGRSAEASYRFIAAVMPLITGDELKAESVARSFQRRSSDTTAG
jgi:hypothetical protein